MVTKREVLEELTLPKLKRVARQLGIQVPLGVSGYLVKAGLGMELRRPYIEALANSPIVNLESIDRVFGTDLSGKGYVEPTKRREAAASRGRTEPHTESEAPTRKADPSSPAYILGRYLYKEDVQSICEELNLPTSGTKEDLIERILTRSGFELGTALGYVDKEGLKEICEELDLRTSGTREDLEVRIRASHLRETLPQTASQVPSSVEPEARRLHPAPESPTAPRPPLRREFFAPQDLSREVPLDFPETPSSSLIPETQAPQLGQLQMVTEFLERYRPSQRFRNEQAYEIELAQAMRHYFGEENVKTQANIAGGRIDIEVLGIGVEVKVPSSRSQLQTLLGQVSVYRNFYGPNVTVVVFNDFAKVQDVNEFSNILRGRGIQVFIK